MANMLDKHPRMVVVIEDGILKGIYGDEPIDLDILMVDVDWKADLVQIFRKEPLLVDPEGVDHFFEGAEEFWIEEDAEEAWRDEVRNGKTELGLSEWLMTQRKPLGESEEDEDA